ncbi:hypothetical protein [Mycolicibacterium sp.]|uniref:hypothetical protein n=1 Tax=Mycolicibacterium sp. TaxID=2320850 RepID=UPI003D139F53
MKFGFDAKTVCMLGAAAAATLVLGSPSAGAQPVPEPVPAPVPGPQVAPGPQMVAPVAPLPGPDAAPLAVGAADVAAPAEGVPHLMSPDNPPPGTSTTPVQSSQPRLTYLRELWHAMQTQEVSGSDALLLLTQRPLVAANPPPAPPVGPQPALPAEIVPVPAPTVP